MTGIHFRTGVLRGVGSAYGLQRQLNVEAFQLAAFRRIPAIERQAHSQWKASCRRLSNHPFRASRTAIPDRSSRILLDSAVKDASFERHFALNAAVRVYKA